MASHVIINAKGLKKLRYDREISAKVVAELIDSSPQYVLNMENGKSSNGEESRTSMNFLDRFALVYGDDAVAELITNPEHRALYKARAAKRKVLLEQQLAAGK